VSDRGRGRPFAARRGRLLPGEGPLSRVPPVVAFAVVAALFAAGVLLGGVAGTVLLGLLAVGVAVLLATTWPRLSTPERLGRVLVLAVLVAVTIATALR
jgi:predicted neutral ceramidase superfamily lipid hydrolase